MKNISTDKSLISDKLITYLRDQLKNPEIEYRQPLMQLQGGYETSIYQFQLKGVGGDLSQLLVLRLYPQFYGSQNAIWESTVQNALADEGYPVAKAHLICTDMTILGGAFFIMDYIPGQPLMFAASEIVPDLMGKTHAALHQIDPYPLVERMRLQGEDEYNYSFSSRMDWLKDRAQKLPWIAEAANWITENRPPEPERLSVCHGDFHALNILVKDGRVTGILDWGGFAIADPVFDVANTLVLTTIPTKYLTASMEGFSSVDWDMAAELYLSAYQERRELDPTHLDYYRVRRCLMSLVQGVEGQKVWQHPLIVADLISYIEKITGILIEIPA